jgi:kynurenine 3-monooxygenase
MRHSVTTLGYIFKKTLDDLLYSLISGPKVSLTSLGALLSRVPYPAGKPYGWLPLYTMVTFRPDISYATARRKAARQASIMVGLGWVAIALVGVVTMWLMWQIFALCTDRRV